ncbi:hypothetical protein M378DRAFT_190396 [Amanita muscaria Koide BX008]|uniref:Integral membrane protein n=1 Tax=Amanita muscaria (strain Koide BX008) TaxID=946122 RepID=A0A0C2TPM8_AMAMK|nr:hypothetical protein M378DRAFT_190396 [Amanita muscaria Koide BX008]
MTDEAYIEISSKLVFAHEHHEDLSAEALSAPVDSILWIHIFLQAAVWGVLFPIGMVLGLSRSRYHVPLQSTGFALTFAGYFLGHGHKGRQFPPSAHGHFSNFLLLPILLQLSLGVYLKLHIHEKTLRPYAVMAHGIVGKSYPILGWVQMVFGALAFGGFCRGGHLGQCLAHFIMGGAFIAYGALMTILLLAGEAWLRYTGRSPEWWDSWVIMLWVNVNTFTEHHGDVWSVKDLQHTTLGVLWWAGGLLGIFLARNNQRNVVPSIILMMTGWAMSSHAQALMISTKVHSIFGYTLMAAGLTRLIEICFLPAFPSPSPLRPQTVAATDDDNNSDNTLNDERPIPQYYAMKEKTTKAFRHLTPFLLVSAGLLFMSATDEELKNVHDHEIDHVTYVLIMYSLAFIIYFFINFLINLYKTSGRNAASHSNSHHGTEEGGIELRTPLTGRAQGGKWYARVNTEVEGSGSGPINLDDGAAAARHVIGDDED